MTGFGRAEASSEGISITVEAKSVNSRYLDISLRLPQSIQDKELELKEIAQDRISRGKLNLNVRINKAETGEPDVKINPKLVAGYKQLLDRLREAADIKQEVTLRDLLQFNDLFISREEDEETLETIWEVTKEATKDALDQLIAMRKQEGKQLENDLLKRVDQIKAKMDKVQELTEGRANEVRKNLLERIHNLIDEDLVDEERLEMEVAVLVDKMDITEEIVRLKSHIKFFREAIEKEESVGRRLNFLSQEMNREINTIGSKANNSEISQHVVHAKESLEQIKEQIQNVE
ncbi:YicC family protein [Balneolaceae bacterium YR4-1]|uniref:YicC family protein n=2 Tax=Halalkalibaculum roseum TaxID=2709311 RepID=A0A6M1T524_9BACT|nr:YicC family protein [Halalkalibaculum roseum]